MPTPARSCGTATVADYKKGHAITSPPTVYKNLVVTGIAGGEYGIRGFVQAFDQNTGKSVWKTYTIPGPGEPGNETWKGDSWKTGAGSTWLVGSFDPKLNLVYWSTSNGGPWGGQTRGNDSSDIGQFTNLWTSSQLAFDADTGKIAWGYQYTPSDVWDYDGVNEGGAGRPQHRRAEARRCCCMPTATASSTCSTARPASCYRPNRSCR